MTDDTHTWQCADCPKKNPLSVWKCICGYVRPKPERGDGFKDRRFCSFISASGRQCPLPGDISHDSGKDARGWCAGHVKLENRSGPIAEQIFEDNVTHYDEIMGRTKQSFHNDPVGWWEREGKAEAERLKAERLTMNPARLTDETGKVDEAAAERAAIQEEQGGFADERF